MRVTSNLILATLAVLFQGIYAQNDAKTLDVVAIAYNSYDSRAETLLFASIDDKETPVDSVSTLNAGMGQHLWQIDEDGPEMMRGWMFRLRLTIQAVMDEYHRRGKQDYLAIVSDAADVFVSKTLRGDALTQLKHRFLTQFNDSKIVFSTQIYCCNPWELRSVGRADWDRLYENNEPTSIYKHLNAGLYFGYASAIIEMAEEMDLWNKDYHRHEGFHSLMDSKAAKYLSMKDMEVDDDEWQLSAWFFKDQAKARPLAALDFNQDLFAVTGTFRAQQQMDSSWHVFSRQHFLKMFGPFPSSFPDPESNLDRLLICPYEHSSDALEWTNTITGSHPLIFHFAGNDWLCACKVFAAEGFTGITGKFRKNCNTGVAEWNDRVRHAMLQIAHGDNSDEEIFLLPTGESGQLARQRRNLNEDDDDEDGGPYDRRLERRRGEDAPYGSRALDESDDDDNGPYDGRQLRPPRGDDRPYGSRILQADDNDDEGPDGDRRLRRRRGDDGPYGRRDLDEGPYDDRRLRRRGDDGPYDDRRLNRRRRDDGPYGRLLKDEFGSYDDRRMKRGRDDNTPYGGRVLDENDDDKGPYDNRRLKRRRGDDGPYGRLLQSDDDDAGLYDKFRFRWSRVFI